MPFLSRDLVVPNRREKIGGFVYWPFYFLFLGTILALALSALGFNLEGENGEYLLNLAYFTVNFVVIALIFQNFLYRSFAPITHFGRFLLAVLMSYGVYYALNLSLAYFLEFIQYSPENLNQDTVSSMMQSHPLTMFFGVVIFAPITEECLCRALIFGPVCRKCPWLAYVLSAAVFSAIHVVGSIGVSPWLDIFLCFLIYLPSGLALCFAYQRTRTIWGSITLHALMNLLAFAVNLLG